MGSQKNLYRFGFIIPNLDYGGAEKVCATYVNELSKLGHSCRIFLSEDSIQFPLNPSVSIRVINSTTKKRGLGKLLFLFRFYSALANEIQSFSPDILVSSLPLANLQTLIALKFMPAQKRPYCIIRQEGKFRGPTGFLTKRLYPTADIIIAVSKGLRNHILNKLCLSPHKVVTIYNPFNLNEVETQSLKEVDHPWFASKIPVIINVARLVKEKNLRLLIRAFKKVTMEKPAHLVLIGEGPLKPELENLVTRLGLSHSVCFLGFVKNPYRYISKSKVFVLSSRSEGLPSVLIEAMCCETLVVSTNCEFGPKEIIKDEHSGYLVSPDNEIALANKILSVLDQKKSSALIVENAKEAIKKFDLPHIMSEFFSLLPKKK